MNEGKDCILSKSGEKEKNERRKRRMPSCSVASEFVDDPVVWVVVTSITRTRQKRSTCWTTFHGSIVSRNGFGSK
ncbi:hypothetical protein MANES_15G071150v8 [Manihot esculenta]|uniref:Uncharacterized protein n=1 Tax=Manihot esculenta TaxID=3983 RepID=A0ACB7G9S9_MANES|nr:hypothetical protein MANES_15G071150v8 [Manihot esculenta]